MSLQKDIIDAEIHVSGTSKVQSELINVRKSIFELSQTNKNLTYQKNLLEAQNQKGSKAWLALKEAIDKNGKAIHDLKLKESDLLSQTKLTEMSHRQLKKYADELRRSLNDISKELNPDVWNKLNNKLIEVQGQMNKVKAGTQNTKTVFENLTKGVTAGNIISNVFSQALSSIKSFLSGSVDQYDKSEKSSAQLEAAIKSTGGAAGRSVQQLEAQAKALQKATLFEDEMTLSAQSLMLTFTNVKNEVFDKSIPLILDMSTALATATGGEIDLKAASIQVGKALNSPIEGITALKKVGVSFNDQQKEQIKLMMESGDVASAQSVILNELQKEFGGSAEAAAKAGTGGWTQFKNTIGDVAEKVGGFIINGLSPLTDALKYMLTPQATATEKFNEQKTSVKTLTTEIYPLLTRYDELKRKTTLSVQEQSEMKDIINKVGEVIPFAVTKFNKYGEAIDISTAAGREFIKIQQRQMELLNSNAIKENENEIQILTTKIDLISNSLRKGTKDVTSWGITSSGRFGAVSKEVKLTAKDFTELRATLKDLQLSKEATQKTINDLKGIKTEIKGNTDAAKKDADLKKQWSKMTADQLREEKEENLTLNDAQLGYIDELIKAKEKETKKTESEAKKQSEIRKAAIMAGLEPLAREKAEFEKRLQEAGITEAQITAIRQKSADSQTAIETEKLTAYDVLNKQYLENVKKITEKEQEYRNQVVAAKSGPAATETIDHTKRLKDAGITEAEITAIQQKTADQQTDIEKQKLQTYKILNETYQNNLGKIEVEAITKVLAKRQQQYERELSLLKTKQNNELASVTTLEQAKELLKDSLSEKELNKLDTLEKAKGALKELYEKQQNQLSVQRFQELYAQFQNLLQGGDFEGINLTNKILTPEQKAELEKMLTDLALKLSEFKTAASGGNDKDDKEKGKDKKEKADILGFTQDDWQNFYSNLKDGTAGIDTMIMAVKALSNVYQTYSNYVSAQENKQLAAYEKSNKKKKADLTARLKAGKISQESYNSAVETMDAELEKKKSAIELKQAKRERNIAIMNAIANTAVAVTSALGTKPPPLGIALAIVVGLLGAAQIATILSTPLAGAEEGQYIDVTRQQDGKQFNAEYDPDRRGFVDHPTVIVGEGPIGQSKEFIASNAAVENPTVRPILDLIDKSQRDGTIRTLNMNRIIMTEHVVVGKSSGGSIAGTSSGSGVATIPVPIYDQKQLDVMDRFSNIMEKISNEGLKGNWYYKDFETIQNDVNHIRKESKIK